MIFGSPITDNIPSTSFLGVGAPKTAICWLLSRTISAGSARKKNAPTTALQSPLTLPLYVVKVTYTAITTINAHRVGKFL